MDPRLNPYAPGAGTPPPELAGRDDLIERAAIALDRIRSGKPDKSLLLIGLRGVGKTVLLNRIMLDAEARGFHCVRLEAPEGRSLPALLAPAIRAALIRLDRGAAAGHLTRRALAALAGFVCAFRLKFGDIEVAVEAQPEPGLADSGDLEIDLADLLAAVAQAAAARETAAVLFIDELQYVPEQQLAALITALHQCAQRGLSLTLVGAGLPQLVGQMGRARSYAERLFEFPEVGPLDQEAAKRALATPAEKEGVSFTPDALEEIIRQTQRYPYFLQEWGSHAWAAANRSPITRGDIDVATRTALADLDASFFRVRFDRLTPTEKAYLRAMAELGPGPHKSGDIAAQMGRTSQSMGPTRSSLIAKGMIYSPQHGDTAFTVPLFDGFMKRTMPAL
jgi:hypothetical protein